MLVVRPSKSQHPSRNRSGAASRRQAGRVLKVVTAVSAALMPAVAGASPWEADPNITLDDSNAVSQKVELVDINADGFVDIVFANSSGELTGNENDAQLNQLFINDNGAAFAALGGVFEAEDNAFVIKAGDIDGDGDADLVVGVNFFGNSYVLINEGGGVFTPQPITPGTGRSIGDLELGDVDGDGNLDVVATDWGMSQPYGDGDDFGGPIRLWLGNGDGTFDEGESKLPMGMNAQVAWSYDLELVDIDNDYALDILVSSRGSQTKARVLHNDGSGNFALHPVAALQPMNAKNVNVSFTPMDFDGDGYLDVLTLQDGGGQGACVEIDGNTYCGKRNSVIISDTMGQFVDNPSVWEMLYNSAKLDFDAATLDFDNNGRPDFVVTGVRLGGLDNNSRLMLNSNNDKFVPPSMPLDEAFPVLPELAHTFSLMFADFNRDGREDVAVAQRGGLPNFALFGKADMADGVPLDTTPPRIYDDGFADKLGTLLYFGKDAGIMARVNDYKTPTHWHDHRFDPNLDSYNLIGDGAAATAHQRRLPYMEFALSLANPDDLLALPDGDPKKFISPSIWFGEALWRVGFKVPYNGMPEDTLTWQYCAIDAADNKTCVGPFSVKIEIHPDDCGDGVKEEWEECDDDSPNCVACSNTCGNGVCDENETPESCPEDCGEGPCNNDDACQPPETPESCPDDCDYEGFCGDDICQDPPENAQNCPEDCDPCNHDGACQPPEDAENCPDDCDYDGFCGDNICQEPENELNCPEDCGGVTESDSDSGAVCGDGVCEDPENYLTCPEDCDAVCGNGICEEPAEDAELCPEDCGESASFSDTSCPDTAGGADGQCQLDDDGCGCNSEPGDTRGLWASLLLFGVFGVRRFRRRA